MKKKYDISLLKSDTLNFLRRGRSFWSKRIWSLLALIHIQKSHLWFGLETLCIIIIKDSISC